MLEEFSKTYSGKTASTWDFKHVAEKAAGKKLDWFFDQWVFATGLPSYSVDYKVNASGQQFTVEGRITQTGVPDGFLMSVPVFADNDLLGVVEVGESEGDFKFRVNKKPESLVIDPEMTVLSVATQ
jgi:aminopeptidase N